MKRIQKKYKKKLLPQNGQQQKGSLTRFTKDLDNTDDEYEEEITPINTFEQYQQFL